MSGLLREVEAGRVIVAIDPGNVVNRVWVTTAAGVVGEPVSLPTSRTGMEHESATVRRRGAIARTGLPEHRDALIGIAWGLGQFAPAFQQRLAELNTRGKRGIDARVALARHACRLCWRMLHTQQPYDDRRYDRARRDRGR